MDNLHNIIENFSEFSDAIAMAKNRMKPLQTPLIIYHANCLDGFGAAYAAHKYFSAKQHTPCEFIAASHGDEPPDCSGKQVYIVDFSYKRPLLKHICQTAQQVTIIDHHISAEKDLKGLEQEHENLKLVFDMQHSGAVLSWQYFHPTPTPELLLHVQDQDLWQFQLPDSRDVNAALGSYPFEFDRWDVLVQNPQQLAQIKQDGQAINRYLRQQIDAHKRKAHLGNILGHAVPIVNCPKVIVSQLLHELAEDYPFAAGYQDNGLKRGWSLRSREDGMNVAAVAEHFGGGGHAHAAGFRTFLPDHLLHLQG